MDPRDIDLKCSEYDDIRTNRPASYQIAIDAHLHAKNDSKDCVDDSLFDNSTQDAPYSFSTSMGATREFIDNKNSKYAEICDRKCTCCVTNKNHLSSTSSEASLLSCASEKPTKSRLIVFCVCMQISFFLATIVFLTILFVMLHNVQNELEQEQSERTQQSNTFCLPCNDLILGPMDEDNEELKQLIRRQDGELEVCCAKGSNQTSVLMNLFWTRKEKLKEAQEIVNKEEKCNITNSSSGSSPYHLVSAHLLAGVQSASGSPPYTVRNWIKSSPTAHSSGVQVKDSRIIVNTSGLYFVYSQIFFSNLYNSHTVSNSSQALYHYVYRWNIIYPNNGNELLLKSVRTQCWSENRIYGDYTSYTSGAFMLNTGDELYVQASKLDIISRDAHASFFGIVKL